MRLKNLKTVKRDSLKTGAFPLLFFYTKIYTDFYTDLPEMSGEVCRTVETENIFN